MASSAPTHVPYSMSRATFSSDSPAEREAPKKKWQMVQETRTQKSPPPAKPQPSTESHEKVKWSKESSPKTEKPKTSKEPSQKSEKKSRTKSCNSPDKKSQKKRKGLPKRKESKQKPIGSVKKSTSKEDLAAEPVAEKKNWKKKAAEGFQLHMVVVIVSLILQLVLTFFIMAELIKASGPVLLFLVGAMVGLLPSLFFTLKVIFSRSKIWLLLGAIDAALVMGLALAVLIVQTQKDYSKINEKQEQETKLIQRLAAVTIIVLVCNVLAIGNYFYYTKWGNKKKADEEEDKRAHHSEKKESKRASGGAEPPPPNCRQMAYMIEAGST